MPRVVIPGAEAVKLVGEIKFENLPKYVNSKSQYIRWAVSRRLENKDFSMEVFEETQPPNGAVA